MRILRFRGDGATVVGALLADGEGVVDLRRATGGAVRKTSDLFLPALREAAERALENAEPHYRLTELHLELPVDPPGKILCVGVNYTDRNAEYRDGSEPPRYPSLFVRSPDSLVAHQAPLLRPPESEQLDYEGEVAIVIGKRGRRIPRENARAYIAGISCFNEGTIRDWTRHGKFNVTQGKNFDQSGAFGPWLVTADEIDPLSPLELRTWVNGELRQHDTTSNLRFPFDFLVEYISTFTTLHPGDVVSTGTPKGSGIHRDPPEFLVPGDIVEVEVSGVGVLRNPVSDELPPR